jgi:hypothetical protein
MQRTEPIVNERATEEPFEEWKPFSFEDTLEEASPEAEDAFEPLHDSEF